MTLKRRGFVSAAGLSLATSAGCLDFLSDATTFEAKKAYTAESIASEHNYVQQEPRELRAERTFSAGGQEQTVTVVSWATEYYKTLDVGPLSGERAGVFAAISTPQVELLGESFNPVGDATPRDVANRFQSQYEGLSVGAETDRRSVRTLGSSVPVSTFDGTATISGQEVDTKFVVSESAENEGDHVVALGVYPRQLDERSSMLTMMENLRHPVEE